MFLKPLESYTLFIEKLITFPEFKVIHLEILFLHKCEAVPSVKTTGMAVKKCSTACIKELSEIMKQTKEWKLIKALIEHGTIPDIRCIEVATKQFNENVAFFIVQAVEKDNHKICYDSLLSVAIDNKWNGEFVDHCLKQGAKFTAKDIFAVLQWKNEPSKNRLLELMVFQEGAMDQRNHKGQLPLDFLLEQGMFNCTLTLLEFNMDTSANNIINTIKMLKKYDTNKHPILKILCKIIRNKKNVHDLKQELASALKHAFSNKQYDVAALLIDHGADTALCVENSTTTVVHVATKIVLHTKGTYISM